MLKGLSAKEKFLQSKYFYDAKGDVLFQKIMASPEYYLTNCEMEIFTTQTAALANTLTRQHEAFDIVELGAGDATKSIHLLKHLAENNVPFAYYPVDISANIIAQLKKNLPSRVPALKMQGLNGEYFQMLNEAKQLSDNIKIVLFLGSNIGNVPLRKAEEFCKTLRSHLSKDDLVIIGFDLTKNPLQILAAYNDKSGFTQAFNLNLLYRINDELSGNFVVENFVHYPTYDPQSGACKSFLVSTIEQQVNVAGNEFAFAKGETIFMEISQKYTTEQTDDLAASCGFKVVKHFYDSQKWFLDGVWQCV